MVYERDGGRCPRNGIWLRSCEFFIREAVFRVLGIGSSPDCANGWGGTFRPGMHGFQQDSALRPGLKHGRSVSLSEPKGNFAGKVVTGGTIGRGSVVIASAGYDESGFSVSTDSDGRPAARTAFSVVRGTPAGSDRCLWRSGEAESVRCRGQRERGRLFRGHRRGGTGGGSLAAAPQRNRGASKSLPLGEA